MRRLALLLALLGLLPFALADDPAPATAEATAKVDWITRWDDAVAEARAQHKPILIDFWADWCTHCVKMDQVVWTRPDVAAAVGHVVPYKAYFERGNEFAKRFNVDVVPWVLLVDPDGNVLVSMRGYQGATQIKRAIAANEAVPPAR